MNDDANTLLDKSRLNERSQYYPSQMPNNVCDITHNSVKTTGHSPFAAADVHHGNDVSSKPPLQLSPNIVEQLKSFKTSPGCK